MINRILATSLLALGLCGAAHIAQAQSLANPGEALVETIALSGPYQPSVKEITVPQGKSVVLRFDTPISEATVGNPETADIVPLTDRSIYVLGKAHGSTNLTLLDPNKQVRGIVNVDVSYDTTSLKKRLYDAFPGEQIEVRTSGDTIVLSGSVSSTAVSARATQLAGTFAPDKVINMMELSGSQQVMLKVRFAEVERNAAKSLGISTNALFDDNGVDGLISRFTTPDLLGSSSFSFLRDVWEIGDVTIDVLLDMLEQRGVASVLAEPTLIAVSGEEASFLAGGEFPIPVATSGNNDDSIDVRIEFKEFGVRLGFTPTVIGDTIAMTVTPEVSELDRQNGIVVDDIIIPGLRTRRATTSVELKHGQSFAIAGLLQKEFLNDLDQMPGVASIPILGALQRSARFKRQETELAIIVTPYIVEPVEDDSLALPTDFFIRPHEFELVMLGKTERGEQAGGFSAMLSQIRNFEMASASVDGSNAALGYVIE